MKNFKVFFSFLFFFLSLPLFSVDDFEDFDEKTAFGNTNSVIEKKEETKDIKEVNEKKMLTFGGKIYTLGNYSIIRDVVFNGTNATHNITSGLIQADLNLDVRLTKGIKGYVAASVGYVPQGFGELNANGQPMVEWVRVGTNNVAQLKTNYLLFNISEVFLDFNLNYLAYFRVGKQVLKWGRGYFWTPTDVINVGSRDFTDLDRLRNGVLGLKFHLPIKTIFNFYTFLNTSTIQTPETYSLSAKAELLLGIFEFAFSVWGKPNRRAIFGFDLSTGILGWNIYYEMTYSQEYTKERLSPDFTTLYRHQGHVFKNVLGFNKSFDQNKFFLGFEAYYNGEGYAENGFSDATALAQFYQNRGFYFLDHSRWYAALFLTFNELFWKTTSISVNAVMNISDVSMMLVPSIVVKPVDQFTIIFRPTFYIGNSTFTELTFSRRFIDLAMELSIVF